MPLTKDFNFVPGGITAPKGFLASGVAVGVRKTGQKDVAIICSTEPSQGAAVFTTNRVKAAPILVSQEHVAGGSPRAVVVNSGCANACTGERGLEDARRMAGLTAEALSLAGMKISPRQVVVASTGVIGVHLPMDRIERGIRLAAAELDPDGGESAAEAILTTDLVKKEVAVSFSLNGRLVTVGGIAKGSGMIHPNMATMLGFLTTDASVDQRALHKALRTSAERSYNMISVDGDTSTNDMVVLLANGASGAPQLVEGSPEFKLFCRALDFVNIHLARAIAADGEGATKLIEVNVTGAPTTVDAKKAAMAVIKSPLVKTAVFGADANWGRIFCAVGYSGAEFDVDRVAIRLGEIPVLQDGSPLPFDEDQARTYLEGQEIKVNIDLGSGSRSATAWGCDFSYDYVRINGSYRT